MNRTIIFTLLFISLIFLGTISATSHYVDKDATGSNNGSSWANAWQSFSSINWSSVRPGDVIYISGGISSKIYYETLTINANGSANNLITIRNGLNSGHNGRVVIDGGSTRKGIVISGDKYIRVAGLETQYCNENILIDGTANVIYLDSLGIYHFRGHGGVKINGHTSSGANDRIDSIFVRYCDMVHLDNVSDQTDVFYTQYGIQHLFIIDNYIKMKNNYIPSSHSDLFHFDHQTMDITISGNTIIGLSDGISGMKNNGLIAGEVKGDVYFYNNVLYYPTADVAGQNVFTQFDDGYESTWYIYSNTFIGGTTPNLFKIEDTDCTIKNNIFFGDASRSSAHIIFRHFPSAAYSHNDWSKIDNNLYGNNVTGSSIANVGGSGKSMSAFNALGAETSGTPANRNKVNPLLTDYSNEDFTLQSGSPAIDAGTSLGSPYNVDINGVARPQGTGWDVGAYEIQTGPDVTSPKLQGALINNPIQVALSFSESLDSQSAQNESNYSIDNGINVLSASLSSNNRDVILTTSEHSPNEQYTVTVINVKDLAGNTISSQANSAQYLLEADTSPPELTGAALVENYSTLVLLFGEQLESNSASEVNNYLIDNGIQVLSAELLADQLVVQLVTTEHTQGQSYQVVVSNVTDLAGNMVSSSSNSAQYEAISNPVDLVKFDIISATASSTSNPDYYAGLTIDGLGINEDPNSRWAAIPMPEHLIFDLGESKVFAQSKFSFYGFEFGRIYTYSVLVSNDNTNWTEVLTDRQSALEEWSTEIFAPVSGRFIKLLFITSNQATQGQEWAHLWEAEIWGSDQISETETEGGVPTNYELSQNYPNPFNPATNISFSLPEDSRVRITVYNLLGELVAEPVNSYFASGSHTIAFDADGFTSGIYLYRMQTGNFTSTKKMILLK